MMYIISADINNTKQINKPDHNKQTEVKTQWAAFSRRLRASWRSTSYMQIMRFTAEKYGFPYLPKSGANLKSHSFSLM